jgi:hypothetical protein
VKGGKGQTLNLDTMNCRAENLRWTPRGTSRIGKPVPAFAVAKPARGSTHPLAVLTSEQVGAIRCHYRAGWTLVDIAGELDCSISVVRGVIDGRTYQDIPDPLGPIAKRGRGRRKGVWHGRALLGETEIVEARRLRNSGWTYSKIGEALGVSDRVVSRAIRGKTYRDNTN